MGKDIYEKIQEKYKEKTGKELSPDVLADKLTDFIIKLEGGTIDLEEKLSNVSNMTDAEFIASLSDPDIFFHTVYGKAKGGDFDDCGELGELENYPSLQKCGEGIKFVDPKERLSLEDRKIARKLVPRFKDFPSYRCYSDAMLFKEDVYPSGSSQSERPNFEAKVFGFNISSGDYVFQMWYLDNTHDPRPGSYVKYIFVLPKDKKNEIVPRIKKNPTLLIDTFKKLFGNLDNSQGTLGLDPNFKPLIEDAEGN